MNVILVLHIRWICVYCNKIMDKSNFAQFIEDSDNKNTEYHGWRLILEEE